MKTIDDVKHWFRTNRFLVNPLITIIVVGGYYYAPRILSILIQNDKNDPKRFYTNVYDYLNYLES